jgi:hypothetical protein
MKYALISLVGVTVFLSGCSTPLDPGKAPTPEMVIYHVKRGAEHELEVVLTKTWRVYQSERVVCSEPHVLIRTREDDTHDCYVDVFTWTGCFAMEYPSTTDRELQAEAVALCEERGGKPAVEFRGSVTKMIEPRLPRTVE